MGIVSTVSKRVPARKLGILATWLIGLPRSLMVVRRIRAIRLAALRTKVRAHADFVAELNWTATACRLTYATLACHSAVTTTAAD
jgi:hypothetical protein